MTGILLQIVQGTQGAGDVVLSTQHNVIRLSVWELTLKGGWIMLPIILLSFIAVYIFIERFLIINRSSKDDRNFMNNIRDFVHGGRLDAANALCKSYSTPIARMIEKGLARLGKPLNDINAAIEDLNRRIVANGRVKGEAGRLSRLGLEFQIVPVRPGVKMRRRHRVTGGVVDVVDEVLQRHVNG